jgi:hypothetical protein
MKTLFVSAMGCLLAVAAFAQPGSRRPDSTGGGSSYDPYRNSVLRADVLEGRSAPQRITPNGQKICFDKRVKAKVITDRGPAEVCLFVNTKIGLTAYMFLRPGGSGFCDIKPDDPQFKLTVIGMKGNVYTYMNAEKNGMIQHWVQTDNSNRHLYQNTSSAPNAILYKKIERRDYCDGKIKAQCYKVDAKPEQWFLFGKQFPDALTMKPAKYLGNFAIGYADSDKGLFIIMQMVGAGLDSKIVELEDVRICFDPSPFKVFEDELESGVMSDIRKQRERIERDAARAERYPACESKKAVLINFQREALQRQEENLRRSRQGNTTQDMEAQKAMANLMNYDDMVQGAIYEGELSLCRAQQSQAESPSESTQRSIDCLQRQIAALRNTQSKFIALNSRMRDEPGMLFAEKAKLFLQAMIGCD